MRETVYIKLEGVLAEEIDPPSRWAIGNKLPGAEAALAYALTIGEPVVFGLACDGIKGQRAVQRWLVANGLGAADTTYAQEENLPKDARVIHQWPIEKTGPSASPPAVLPQSTTSNSPNETPLSLTTP